MYIYFNFSPPTKSPLRSCFRVATQFLRTILGVRAETEKTTALAGDATCR